MPDFDTTVHALRRWAAQMDESDRAAVELLCWHEHWLRNASFTAAVIERRGAHLAISWRAAREFCDSKARGSTSEMAVLDLAITLAEDRFRFRIMGSAHSRAIVRAVAVALGEEVPGA
jgi:hypothetical protein